MSLLKQATFNTKSNRPSFYPKRNIVIAALTLGAVVLASIIWWLASPLFINIVVDEPFPFATDGAMVVNRGHFVDMNFLHRGSGSATVLQQGDQRVLRLEAFEVTNGPDLRVLLVENIEGTDNSNGADNSLGEHVDLGALKGNIGNQNYKIPADVDLSKYGGVMIYCEPFHVVFSTADFGG
ncbi:MAG: DM13 domain-containing protein [Chloroflexota bacterium]